MHHVEHQASEEEETGMVVTLMTSRGEQCPHEEEVVFLPHLPQAVEVALVMEEGEMGAVAGAWEETEMPASTLMATPA